MQVAVVILNWNGSKWLQQFLPSVQQFLPTYASLYVADNASTDDSLSLLAREFPSVRVITLQHNYGFAKGYNEALKNLSEDIFVLLNSDVEIKSTWIEPIVAFMENNPHVAVCQPKILDQVNAHLFEYAGASGGYLDYLGYPFCRGRIFTTLEADKGQYDSPQEIFWATGACMFVRSAVYKTLGGLDDDFFAHMEEIDFCWRVQKLNLSIYVVPSAIVYHVGGGTLQRISPKKTYLNFRNNLYMLYKNQSGSTVYLVIFYRLFLDGIAGLKFLLDGDNKHFIAVIKAHFSFYTELPKLHQKRKKIKTYTKKHQLKGWYPKSIVWQYFVKKHTQFSDLKD